MMTFVESSFAPLLDLCLSSQVFFVESVCEDPDVIQENIVVRILRLCVVHIIRIISILVLSALMFLFSK